MLQSLKSIIRKKNKINFVTDEFEIIEKKMKILFSKRRNL